MGFWEITRDKPVKVYAFDVDETLEVSGGPVAVAELQKLRDEGHVVGICGNWAGFCQRVIGWQNLVSFMSVGVDKALFLHQLALFVPGDDFIMVGNIQGVSGSSDDKGAVERANTGLNFPRWRFIKESDFAAGAR